MSPLSATRSPSATATLTIVGVTSDLRQNLYERPMPEVDVPAAQVPAPTAEEWGNPGLAHMQLVIRSTLPPAALATAPCATILHRGGPHHPLPRARDHARDP